MHLPVSSCAFTLVKKMTMKTTRKMMPQTMDKPATANDTSGFPLSQYSHFLLNGEKMYCSQQTMHMGPE